jgi:hypothetical protein
MGNFFRIIGVLLSAVAMIGFGVCGAFGLFGGMSFDFNRLNPMLIFFGLWGIGFSALAGLLLWRLVRRIAGRGQSQSQSGMST